MCTINSTPKKRHDINMADLCVVHMMATCIAFPVRIWTGDEDKLSNPWLMEACSLVGSHSFSKLRMRSCMSTS